MSEQEENNENAMESETTLTSLTPNETQDLSTEAVSEKEDKNVKEQNECTPSIPANSTKSMVKEKPKVTPKRSGNDVEEFDTDEEEEDENKPEQQNYTDRISYEGDKCIYTEPETGRKLVWNKKENKWCADEQTQDNSEAADAMKNYEFDGKHYVYTDKTSNVTYKFIQEKNEWVVKDEKETDSDKSESDKSKEENAPTQPTSQGIYGFENDTHTYTDPSDGTSYFWDKEKNAWFPKIDDDFMARYQMSYGFTGADSNANTESNSVSKAPAPAPPNQPETKKLTKEEKKAENKRKNQEPPTWFEIDEAHNTAIYIANLPLDITMEEVKELVTKCGLLARDEKGKDKLKLYIDENGEIKGDARCTYIKIESVDLALKILDGSELRGHTLSVQRAKFQLRGQYDPSKKPKRKKKDKDKQKKIHERLFDWRPDRMRGEPLKCERVVIIKNLFQPEDFDKDVTLLLEYQQDVRSECAKCGEVKKVTIYDRHPEGVAQVAFKEVEAAQACIQLLHGRWFGQRKITAEIWDGRTKYKIHETEEEIEARINKWDKFLEEQDDAEEKAKNSQNKHSPSTSSTEAK